MMHSPPRAFGTPTRTSKSKSRHSYGAPFDTKNTWSATENPQIQYTSPPRKKSKQNHYNSAPSHIRRHQVVVSNHNDHGIGGDIDNRRNSEHFSSPISRRYHSRIGTSLYDEDDQQNNTNSNLQSIIESPIRTRKRKYLEQASPISPTFQPIHYLSPSKHSKQNHRSRSHLLSPTSNSCDRYTPNRGNINRYNLHSPTKRFVHNNNSNMMSYTNVISPQPKKRRKLGQNYSGTNDDPSSLNHRLKQKLSQHTYNQVLQSELLGFAAEHTNIVNQVFRSNDNNDATEKNDNISQIQMDITETEEDNNNNNNNSANLSIMGSPSLPNRRIRASPNRNNDRSQNGNSNSNSNSNTNTTTHHPLCPCYNNGNDVVINGRNGNDEQSMNSDESGNQMDITFHNNNDDLCVCDSITSNVATNFLVSPQRTLRYDYNDEYDQENIGENGMDINMMRMTPIKSSTQSQLSGSRKSMRNIAKSPFKVLDAPRLNDDFYLNLVDWSSSCNILSVGLGECVYLWSAFTSKVTKLTDLTKLFEECPNLLNDNAEYNDGFDMVCSVGWSKNHESALSSCSIICGGSTQYGNHNSPQRKPSSTDFLAVGSGSGYVFVFDTVKSKLSRSPLSKHNHRVGVISWKNNNILSSGSRDRNIYLRDIRCNDNNTDIVQQLTFHKQEVCGLKWSEDSLYLASGGNDNKLAIWDIRYNKYNKPLCFGKHKAAVKAITWSPHESGLIATGGGTADRCIKFWNINSFASSKNRNNPNHVNNGNNNPKQPFLMKPIEVIDTGSQVCNLLWSKNVNEIVSTHGYSLNQIVVWKYPTMDKIVTLTGHTYRVLYLAGSPDGQTIVTGAGDETLRLWSIFPPTPQNGNDNSAENFVPQTYSIPLHIR